MVTADEQIRVSDQVKSELDRRRREGESYNDVLERILANRTTSDFEDGYGLFSDEQATRIREHHEEAKEKRKQRTRRLDER